MSGKRRRGFVTVDKEVDVEVEVDCADVIEECATEDLVAELRRRDRPVEEGTDVLTRIWRAVMYQGQSLEDVVSDLMRERTWPWRTGGRS